MKNFKTRFRVAGLLIAAGFGAGCVSTDYQQPTAAHDRAHSLYIEEQFRNYAGRIGTLEEEISLLKSEIDQLKAGHANTLGQAQQEISQLKQELSTQRAEDRNEIVDTITGKVTQLINASRPAPGGGGDAYGREHKVEAGQTLSEITRAYGVSMSSVIKANSLKEPYILRIGQKLFIPD
ncbi:MAG: LysM peptidoglycan-binding domain-containing protein [Verrucomicrobiota bacterium]